MAHELSAVGSVMDAALKRHVGNLDGKAVEVLLSTAAEYERKAAHELAWDNFSSSATDREVADTCLVAAAVLGAEDSRARQRRAAFLADVHSRLVDRVMLRPDDDDVAECTRQRKRALDRAIDEIDLGTMMRLADELHAAGELADLVDPGDGPWGRVRLTDARVEALKAEHRELHALEPFAS